MRGHAAGGGAGSGHAAGHEGEAPVCVPEDRCTAPGLRAAHGGPGMGTLAATYMYMYMYLLVYMYMYTVNPIFFASPIIQRISRQTACTIKKG